MSLAQISAAACPPPCEPVGDDFNPDTDHEFHTTIDVTEDVIEDEEEIVDEVIEESAVRDLLVAVVGCDEAGDIVDNIVKPMVELEVAEMLPIQKVVDVIKNLNDDEQVDQKDPLPTHEEVWETIVTDEKRAVDEPEVHFHDAPTLTQEQMDNATVTTLKTKDGKEVDVIVVNKAGVVVTKDMPCPAEELEEKAEEIADEVVSDLEEEIHEPPVVEEPKPEPKPAPKPKKPKTEVYKTTVETMPEDANALDKLLEMAGGKPLILDFQYDACGHCQEIAPEFEDLMKKYQGDDPANPNAFFYKVDIFQHRDRL
jgi:thiol-disulfide isomerase/thioredoxin